MHADDDPGRKVLLAASLVSMVLGSIHGFSVFLEPIEARFGTSRATASLIYSFSLVFLTLSVLLGPGLYRRLKPSAIYLLVALFAGLGLGLSAVAPNFWVMAFGFSVVFGLANGLGYGFGLQFAARANPARPGLAMGLVTAAYALGAVLAPYGYALALDAGGLRAAMLGLAVLVILASLLAAGRVAALGVAFAHPANTTGAQHAYLPPRKVGQLWLAYGTGVAAGLMAIGHAAGIAAPTGQPAWLGAAVIAGCNLIGSLLCGWLADRVSHRLILVALPLLGASALMTLAAAPAAAIPLLGVIGFAYGGTIATYPAAITALFPAESGPVAYGRIFTAWGAAGLAAPWLAGRIFDISGGYNLALISAAGLAALSALVVYSIDWSHRP